MKRLILSLVTLIAIPAQAEKLSISFNQARLADVLRVVYSDVLHGSFVLDDEVLKSPALVSVELRDLEPFEIASRMDAVAENHGFTSALIRTDPRIAQRIDPVS